MKDLMGKAIWDFYHDNNPQDMLTETSISTMDVFPTDYLFRRFSQMNFVEQNALNLTEGKVLDIGAGAGSHSLYLQNEKGLEVTALDFSPLSIEVCKLRGIKKTVCADILEYSGEKFDTLLLLMNGTGIFQTFDQIGLYLNKLKSLLNPGGQILIDSTDILYMYRDEDGNYHNPIDEYYGEVDYFLYYKNEVEDPFKWLYLDYDNLEEAAEINGLQCEKITEEGYSYLARLSLEGS